jgi:hypothetical protein
MFIGDVYHCVRHDALAKSPAAGHKAVSEPFQAFCEGLVFCQDLDAAIAASIDSERESTA